MNLKMKGNWLNLKCFEVVVSVTPAVKAEVLPECLQLVPLLEFTQFPADFVEKVGALEATAVAVKADNDGAVAADQNCGPVHLELLRHHLPARRAIPVWNKMGFISVLCHK